MSHPRDLIVRSSLAIATAVALLLFVGLVEPSAFADPPGSRAPDACFPACRSGFVCSPSQQCVSACNPVCSADQQCTAEGQCIAGNQPPPTTPTIGPTNVVPDASVREEDDPKERRRLAPMSWSVYAGAGYGIAQTDYVTGVGFQDERLGQLGPIASVGFGLRKYFTRVVGLQARASALLGVGRGLFTGGLVDGTLRIGPFGTGFPLFFGGGLFLGPGMLSRDGTASLTLPAGAIAEVGFLFGDKDRLELVLRVYGGAGSLIGADAGVTLYSVLVMGYRL